MQNPAPGLLNSVINLLFPSNCPVCDLRSDKFTTSPICSSCWSTISPYSDNSCNICAKPLESPDIAICAECYRVRPFFTQTLFWGLYEKALKEAIHLFKFSRIKRLGKPLGSLLLNLDLPPAQMIVPVPLTKERLKERGFNQSLIIAKHLSDKLKIELSCDLLIKVKDTGYQSMLKRKERLKALKGAFKATTIIDGMNVILVDDVFTTGTTLNYCAEALFKAGAKEVFPLVLARARI